MSNPNVRWAVTMLVMLIGLWGESRAIHLGPRLHLGYQADSILEGATRVQTFRVMPPSEAWATQAGHRPRTFRPTDPQVDGCYVTATANEPGPALAQQISQILLDERIYTGNRLRCEMLPGVIFRVWKGSQSLDVILCFRCGEIATVTNDANGRSAPGVDTLMAGDSRAQFARLAKAAFPDDAVIQAL